MEELIILMAIFCAFGALALLADLIDKAYDKAEARKLTQRKVNWGMASKK